MNTPWILGTIIAILFFAWFEAYAFRHPERENTLSRWIFNLGKTWPLSIFLMGMMVGGLAVHFFWHWCPDQGAGIGWYQELRVLPVKDTMPVLMTGDMESYFPPIVLMVPQRSLPCPANSEGALLNRGRT